MSITEKDIKYFKKTSSKRYRKAVVILLTVMSIFYVAIGLFCIYHGNLWANTEGLNIWQVFNILGEISPLEKYSGALFLSVERLLIGIIWIISGIFIFLLPLFILLMISRRNQRVLEYFEKNSQDPS